MKLATLALASVFALSSTFAVAHTSHHKYKSGARSHSAGYAKNYNRHRTAYGQGRYYGSPNNRGGLVGGSDAGTYGSYQGQYYGGYGQGQYGYGYGRQGQSYGGYGQGQYGYGYGRQGQYYGNPNNRGGLVGGSDAGTYRP
jgi:hypothetical protein